MFDVSNVFHLHSDILFFVSLETHFHTILVENIFFIHVNSFKNVHYWILQVCSVTYKFMAKQNAVSSSIYPFLVKWWHQAINWNNTDILSVAP